MIGYTEWITPPEVLQRFAVELQAYQTDVTRMTATARPAALQQRLRATLLQHQPEVSTWQERNTLHCQVRDCVLGWPCKTTRTCWHLVGGPDERMAGELGVAVWMAEAGLSSPLISWAATATADYPAPLDTSESEGAR